jgi:hypothetical protein
LTGFTPDELRYIPDPKHVRRKGEKELSDERILGSGDFVDRVLQEVEERQLRQMKLQRRGRGIEDIIQEECRKRKVSEEELRKGSRRNRVSEARAAIAYKVGRNLGFRVPRSPDILG